MKQKKSRKVAAYDLATSAVIEIPRAMLGRGMIQVCPQTEVGLYWVDAKEWLFKSGPLVAPPLSKSQKSIIKGIRDIVVEVFDHSESEWHDGLRRSENMGYSIGMWLVLSELYQEFAEGLSRPGKRELFRLVMACEHCPPSSGRALVRPLCPRVGVYVSSHPRFRSVAAPGIVRANRGRARTVTVLGNADEMSEVLPHRLISIQVAQLLPDLRGEE